MNDGFCKSAPHLAARGTNHSVGTTIGWALGITTLHIKACLSGMAGCGPENPHLVNRGTFIRARHVGGRMRLQTQPLQPCPTRPIIAVGEDAVEMSHAGCIGAVNAAISCRNTFSSKTAPPLFKEATEQGY